MEKKRYIRPEIVRIDLDYSISLQMQSGGPIDPPPHGKGNGPSQPSSPFQSPFGDKPFG